MLLKTLISALALSAVGGTPGPSAPTAPSSPATQTDDRTATKAGSQDLGRLLPSPKWILENRVELELPEADLMPLRDGLKRAQRAAGVRRGQLRDLRAEMRRVLTAEPIDRARAEELFEDVLELEHRMKRAQLSARLDVITHLSAAQRQRVRAMSETASNRRRRLRRRIEEIRTLGRRLRHRGELAPELHERLPRIEELIRSGRLGEASQLAKALHADLNTALLSESERK